MALITDHARSLHGPPVRAVRVRQDHAVMDKSNEMSTTAIRRRNKSRGSVTPRQNVLESLATLTPEVRSAVPLVAGSTAAPGSTLAQWVSSRAMR